MMFESSGPIQKQNDQLLINKDNNNSIRDNNPKKNKRSLLLKIISLAPGIRYRDLLRMTALNNGTLTHHLSTLEKNSIIKVIRSKNSNITRYYPASTPTEETLIHGFLKIKTSKEIILYLYKNKTRTFTDIVTHIDKAPSTTSWNLKRLYDSNIVIKKRVNDLLEFSLKNPKMVEKIIENNNNTLLDRSVDSYTTIIDQL